VLGRGVFLMGLSAKNASWGWVRMVEGRCRLALKLPQGGKKISGDYFRGFGWAGTKNNLRALAFLYLFLFFGGHWDQSGARGGREHQKARKNNKEGTWGIIGEPCSLFLGGGLRKRASRPLDGKSRRFRPASGGGGTSGGEDSYWGKYGTGATRGRKAGRTGNLLVFGCGAVWGGGFASVRGAGFSFPLMLLVLPLALFLMKAWVRFGKRDWQRANLGCWGYSRLYFPRTALGGGGPGGSFSGGQGEFGGASRPQGGNNQGMAVQSAPGPSHCNRGRNYMMPRKVKPGGTWGRDQRLPLRK